MRSGCPQPQFYPTVTVEAYRQFLMKQLMNLFRRRDPDDSVGAPQVASGCTQAAALLDTYRSVRKAYLGFHMKDEVQAGMSEDSAAWMAARFHLMLKEDPVLDKDKNLRKCVRWCMEACKLRS